MVYRAPMCLIAFMMIRATVRLLLRLELVDAAEANAVFFGALAVAIILIAGILPQRSEINFTTGLAKRVPSIGNVNAL